MELTELQKDILAGVIEGKSNSEIADKLCYSLGKIKKELNLIYKIFKIKDGDSVAKRTILVREVIKIEFANLAM